MPRPRGRPRLISRWTTSRATWKPAPASSRVRGRAAGAAPGAGLSSGGQNHAHTREQREDDHRDGLLSAQHTMVGRAPGSGSASAWGIENSWPWVLDVTRNEDQNRRRKEHGAENLALLRRLALHRARPESSQGSLQGKRQRAGWDNTYLTKLLAQLALPQMR
jgi:predicted transposase YbfD/YdcC